MPALAPPSVTTHEDEDGDERRRAKQKAPVRSFRARNEVCEDEPVSELEEEEADVEGPARGVRKKDRRQGKRTGAGDPGNVPMEYRPHEENEVARGFPRFGRRGARLLMARPPAKSQRHDLLQQRRVTQSRLLRACREVLLATQVWIRIGFEKVQLAFAIEPEIQAGVPV